MLGDLNGCVGDRLRVGISGGSGISGEYGNGRRVIDLCLKGGYL